MWYSTPLRRSSHATIAPPAPSPTIVGVTWSCAAVHSARPSTGHTGSTAPEASTCWSYMSSLNDPPRKAYQVTIAPPVPSPTIVGDPWSPEAGRIAWLPAAAHTTTPSVDHFGTPAPLM